MSKIIGSVATSHIPGIGGAIAKNLQHDPYWKPFFDGFIPTREWLANNPPDVVVVVYNDHGLNFFLDKMPTFAIGAAQVYISEDEGWGIPTVPPLEGDPALSWAIIEGVVQDEFDVTTCQEMLVDHAVTIPLQLLWPEGPPPVKIVPVAVNTVQHPLPSPARCLKFGQSIGRAIEAYAPALKVLVISSGGLSHQLEGERAGFINPQFDALCLNALINQPEKLTGYTTHAIVELAGSQGAEILNWITGRGIVQGVAREVLRNYHIPISNTASALQVLEQVGVPRS
ncbi:protocatechuate 4,5-dioxygenase subunit beta [Acidocella aquatica]|uniref:Protocatechuate 4,5-dioxygenase subunit beta n=1 Tax=Acidocella aquatica TaxID=1922313 RepID=A0ABQ6A4A9_9PROT|nr:class III extradiol dioxygenase family protein [Acidocella aquatica]GLR66163.1 protocatechuate 4,5-dioxygenase subunit beta [Acidocella aquatica]